MPLAMACGRGDQTIMQGAGAQIQPEADVILTDGRALDPAEAAALAASGVRHLPHMDELLSISLPDKPLYIHFDSDVLRLADLSAVSYPAEGGPALELVARSLARLAGSGRLAALSVTLWNPELDPEGYAEPTVMALVEQLLAQG